MGNIIRRYSTVGTVALAVALAPPLQAQQAVSTTPDASYSKLFTSSLLGGVVGATVVGGGLYLLSSEEPATLVDGKALSGIIGAGVGFLVGQTLGGSRAAGGQGRFSVDALLVPSLLWAGLGGVVTGVVGDAFDPSDPYAIDEDYSSYFVGAALGAIVSSAGFAWTMRRRMRPALGVDSGVSLELRPYRAPNGQLLFGGVLRH